MGASNDSKPAASGDGGSNAQHLPVSSHLPVANRLRSGSVHLPMNPGVLRRHHLLLTIVTLVMTLALLAQALTPHRCRHTAPLGIRHWSPMHVATLDMSQTLAVPSRTQTQKPVHMPFTPACTSLELLPAGVAARPLPTLVCCFNSSASAIHATRHVMGRVPATRTGGFSVTPRREAITAEGWVRDILSTQQRLRAGAAADEPAGHPLR